MQPLQARALLSEMLSVTGGGPRANGEVLPPAEMFATARLVSFFRSQHVHVGLANAGTAWF